MVIAGATEKVLSKLAPALKQTNTVTVARPAKSNAADLDNDYNRALLDQTVDAVRIQSTRTDIFTVSLWYYDFGERMYWGEDLNQLFFSFPCFIKIPGEYFNRDEHTTDFILGNLPEVRRWIELLATEVTSGRNTTPFLLPLNNFRSKYLIGLVRELLNTPGAMKSDEIVDWLRSRKNWFKHKHRWRKPDRSDAPCYHDDKRNYAFEPAKPEEYHDGCWEDLGAQCILNGLFRYGATLIKGFHYDVQPERGIAGKFYCCDGTVQDLTGGRYTYVNVYPNDYFEPKKRPSRA